MQVAINQNEALQNTTVYWEEEVWSYPTYAIWTRKEQVRSVHLRNQHWYLSNWDDEGTYFTLGLPLPDIDSYNGSMQGKAPHEYKDVPIFTKYHTSSGSEEDPTDKQICQSLINLSSAVQTVSTAPHPINPENSIAAMLITMAITTQVQSSTIPGGAGPSGGGAGGPSGGGGRGPPGGGGGGAPGGGNANQPTQGDGKPMGTLPMIFEGDCLKAESFLREFSTYLLVNYDVPALASFIKRIAIALTCIKGPEVN